MKTAEMQHQALTRAVTGQSLMNYTAIIEGFMAKGIPETEIKPRENVFGFNAWKALGRFVRKGEHGVRICTFVPKEQKDGTTKTFPHYTTVFHVKQTDAAKQYQPAAPVLEQAAV
jgi:hypothetical protein